jgi:hypothetical protein
MSYAEDIINVAGCYMIPERSELLAEELAEVEEKLTSASTTLYSLRQLDNDLLDTSPTSYEFGTLLDEEIGKVKKLEDELTIQFLKLRKEVRT